MPDTPLKEEVPLPVIPDEPRYVPGLTLELSMDKTELSVVINPDA